MIPNLTKSLASYDTKLIYQRAGALALPYLLLESKKHKQPVNVPDIAKKILTEMHMRQHAVFAIAMAELINKHPASTWWQHNLNKILEIPINRIESGTQDDIACIGKTAVNLFVSLALESMSDPVFGGYVPKNSTRIIRQLTSFQTILLAQNLALDGYACLPVDKPESWWVSEASRVTESEIWPKRCSAQWALFMQIQCS